MEFGPYPAIVLSIHDGDTCKVDLDLGFGIHQVALSCRLFGINAPELSTDEGKAARDHLVTIMPVGSAISVISHGWDKYGGRFDGTIQLNSMIVNQQMIDDGFAVAI